MRRGRSGDRTPAEQASPSGFVGGTPTRRQLSFRRGTLHSLWIATGDQAPPPRGIVHVGLGGTGADQRGIIRQRGERAVENA